MMLTTIQTRSGQTRSGAYASHVAVGKPLSFQGKTASSVTQDPAHKKAHPQRQGLWTKLMRTAVGAMSLMAGAVAFAAPQAAENNTRQGVPMTQVEQIFRQASKDTTTPAESLRLNFVDWMNYLKQDNITEGDRRLGFFLTRNYRRLGHVDETNPVQSYMTFDKIRQIAAEDGDPTDLSEFDVYRGFLFDMDTVKQVVTLADQTTNTVTIQPQQGESGKYIVSEVETAGADGRLTRAELSALKEKGNLQDEQRKVLLNLDRYFERIQSDRLNGMAKQNQEILPFYRAFISQEDIAATARYDGDATTLSIKDLTRVVDMSVVKTVIEKADTTSWQDSTSGQPYVYGGSDHSVTRAELERFINNNASATPYEVHTARQLLKNFDRLVEVHRVADEKSKLSNAYITGYITYRDVEQAAKADSVTWDLSEADLSSLAMPKTQ